MSKRFTITDAMLAEAALLKIEIRPSENKRRLIDVYKDGEYQCSIGASNFAYWNQLVETEGVDYAVMKRDKLLRRFKNSCKPEVLWTLRLLWLCEN